MVKRRWGKIAALLLSSAAMSAATVPAASAEGEPETGGFNAFTVKAGNGYRMLVLASSQRGYRNGEILVLMTGKGGGVAYFAPATVTATTIDADLGALGRIALEFQPNGRQESVAGCEPGERFAFAGGSYAGTLEFRGEEGYTTVDASEVPFSPALLFKLVCDGVSEGELLAADLPGARLRVTAPRRNGNVSLQVNQNRPGARVWAEATIEEKRGPIRIAREVERAYPATSFDFDPKLRFAILRPPPPFSGAALFLRDAKPGNRWRGNLVVDFPGDSNVSLAGGRFRGGLVHARLDKGSGQPEAASRSSLSRWLSTKFSPIGSATSSPLGPS
jgi:hypothetical protein